MSTVNVAVIGSNGFIGRHLSERLSRIPGCTVHCFGKRVATDNQPNYRQINLLDRSANEYFFRNIDVFYYLASETIPANSWGNPLLDVEKNLVPFLHFAETVAGLNAGKIVYLSSAGTVYGTTSNTVTEDAPKNPFSPYGIVKLSIENFLNYYKVRNGIHYDIYRISNVYGPGQDTSKGLGLINTLLEKIVKDGKVTIFGDGKNLRNYLYVKDAVELLSRSATTLRNSSNIFNLASDDTLTINEVVQLIRENISKKFEVVYEKSRQSDNPAVQLDNSKIKAAAPGFRFTPIRQGIAKTYEYISGTISK